MFKRKRCIMDEKLKGKKMKHPPPPPKNENSQNKSKLRASDRAIGGDLALNKQRVLIAGK